MPLFSSARVRRVAPAALSAALLACALTATASAAATPTPVGLRVAQTVSATTTSSAVLLPAWAPAAGDLTLVAVSTQAHRRVAATVTGAGQTFTKVSEVVNAQGIERLTVFAARGTGAGRLSVALPGNAGAAAVVALRVSGAAPGGTGLRTITSEDGPGTAEGDTAHLMTSVAAAPGDLVVGLGTHRLRTFAPAAGETPVATNVATGTSGSRIALSAWSRPVATVPPAGRVGVGGPGTLSGADDWAVVALAVAPAAASGSAPAGTSTLPIPTPPVPATPVPTTPAPSQPTIPAGESTGRPPYAADSPWNTPITPTATPVDRSAAYIARLAAGPALTSDPTQYTYPVYSVTASTPRVSVRLSGHFSTYTSPSARLGHGAAPTVTGVPVPADAVASAGTDGQLILLDPATGDEWGFWQFVRRADGSYTATNGYRYNTAWSGRLADGKAGRGAGLTYLGGLVRRAELDHGRIDHALALAYKYPSREARYPASKSDGLGVSGLDLPEGSRLQLDPSLTDADFDRWALTREARVMARAMQTYGMYVVDNSGSTKIMIEDDATARWNGAVTRTTVSGIPLTSFRVVS